MACASASGVGWAPANHARASQSRISRPFSSRQRAVNDRPGASSTLTQSGNVAASDSSSRRPSCVRSKASTRRPLAFTGVQANRRSSTARAGRRAAFTSHNTSPVARSRASMPPVGVGDEAGSAGRVGHAAGQRLAGRRRRRGRAHGQRTQEESPQGRMREAAHGDRLCWSTTGRGAGLPRSGGPHPTLSTAALSKRSGGRRSRLERGRFGRHNRWCETDPQSGVQKWMVRAGSVSDGCKDRRSRFRLGKKEPGPPQATSSPVPSPYPSAP